MRLVHGEVDELLSEAVKLSSAERYLKNTNQNLLIPSETLETTETLAT